MFWKIMDLFCRNLKEITTAGLMMVSALIVFIGCLKPLIFNKIKNKDIRGVLLSASNIIGAYAMVAIAFLLKKINFDYYWFTATAFCVMSVFVYWLYENTKARAGIHKLGSFVLAKVGNYITTKFDNIAKDSHAIVDLIGDMTTKTAKKEKRSNKGSDTKNL